MHIFNIACVTLVILLLFVLFTKNQWWREKVRQILQRHFVSPGAGVWQVNAA
jgi:hypothetical protein